MKRESITFQGMRSLRLAMLIAILVTPPAFAASQTWTNAPTDASWITANNWIAGAVPGGINMTGNTVNNDTATFTSPIPASGIGGDGNPILTDDATVNGARSRQIGSIVFDTADCGAYVFASASPPSLPTAESPARGILYVSHNGRLAINEAVTNKQVFLVPILVRLPSSTAGFYNLVNNASDPAATLFINAITNNSADTRGTTFVLSGSNTGTNTVAAVSQSPTFTTGVSGLEKQGSGTWILSGPNNFRASSPINVFGGTLVVQNPEAFSLATAVTISNATLRIDGVTLTQSALALRRGGNIQMNGTATVNGIVVGNQTSLNATLSTVNASDVMTVGDTLNKLSGGAADSTLHVAGPGTVLLNYDATYVGRWTLDAGTTQVGPGTTVALGTGASIYIAAGATLDLTPLGPTSYTLSTATLAAGGSGTTPGSTAAVITADPGTTVDLATGAKGVVLTFTPTAFSGDTAHPALLVAQGTLALGGNAFSIENAAGTPLGIGTYRLIQQASGAIIDGGGYSVVGVTGSGLAAGTVASIQVSGGNVDMVVSAYTAKDLVWTGGSLNADWNIGTDANWLSGATPSVFHNSDRVTFNAVGAANPFVNLVGTVSPGSVIVDTTAADYTFGGLGQIGGSTTLTKLGTGVLILQTANSYSGGTVISNGVLRLGAENAVPSTGAGDVAVYRPGQLDLNNFNNTINALVGDGVVDSSGGGAPILSLGRNNNSGTFSGVIQNSAGTLAVTKEGTGVQTFTGANPYSGETIVNLGTLRVAHPHALGAGTSPLTMNGGALDLATNVVVASLAGTAGTILNDSTSTTNTLQIQGDSTYGGVVADGTEGRVALLVNGGTLRLNGANTYSGGTVVATGAALHVGNGGASAGTGGILANNGATVGMPVTGNPSSGMANEITTADGAGVWLLGGNQASSFNGQFVGGPTATNIFRGAVSIGGVTPFANFLGTVIISNTASVRIWNASSGGDNTTFEFRDGGLFSRDANTIRLGALTGSEGGIYGPSVSGPATWLIGGKNLSTVFSGIVSGSNNIVKTGTGTLTLNGVGYSTNTVTLPDATVVDYPLLTNRILFTGATTVSNGTLRIMAPNNLTNSSSITLAGEQAVLDVTALGYATNQTTLDIGGIEQPTNTVVITTGTLEILEGQSLNGQGSIFGSVVIAPAAVVNVGLGIGTLSVSGTAVLNGTVNMELNRANGLANCDRLLAASFAGGGATLEVANSGPTLVTGDTFQLFSGPVHAFAAVNLPLASADNSVTYAWTNLLAINGSIRVLSGAPPVATHPTNLNLVVSGNTLDLSWPETHLGWTLQTNAVDVANPGYWFPVAESATTNRILLNVDTARTNVFYRLNYFAP